LSRLLPARKRHRSLRRHFVRNGHYEGCKELSGREPHQVRRKVEGRTAVSTCSTAAAGCPDHATTGIFPVGVKWINGFWFVRPECLNWIGKAGRDAFFISLNFFNGPDGTSVSLR